MIAAAQLLASRYPHKSREDSPRITQLVDCLFPLIWKFAQHSGQFLWPAMLQQGSRLLHISPFSLHRCLLPLMQVFCVNVLACMYSHESLRRQYISNPNLHTPPVFGIQRRGTDLIIVLEPTGVLPNSDPVALVFRFGEMYCLSRMRSRFACPSLSDRNGWDSFQNGWFTRQRALSHSSSVGFGSAFQLVCVCGVHSGRKLRLRSTGGSPKSAHRSDCKKRGRWSLVGCVLGLSPASDIYIDRSERVAGTGGWVSTPAVKVRECEDTSVPYAPYRDTGPPPRFVCRQLAGRP